jgi:hypothetical protein
MIPYPIKAEHRLTPTPNATSNDIIRHAQGTLKQHHLLDLDEGMVLFQEGSGGSAGSDLKP